MVYEVEVEGYAGEGVLRSLVDHVDEIAEIPATLRAGTTVTLRGATARTVVP